MFWFSKEVVRTIQRRPIWPADMLSGGVRRHGKGFPRPFAIRRCDDRRLKTDETMVSEVACQLIVAFRFQPRKQCIQRGAQSQVRDCAEVFGRVEFFLQWIFLPFVGRSIRLDVLSGDPHVISKASTHLCVGRSDDIELLDLQFVFLLFARRGTLPCSDQCNQSPSTQSTTS